MVSGRLPWISLYVRQCILYISCNTTLKHQWRIQDFLKKAPTPGKCVCAKISINKFSKIFAENCMIIAEFEPKRHVPITPVPLIVTEQWTKTIIWSYPPSWISNRWLINWKDDQKRGKKTTFFSGINLDILNHESTSQYF